jgi:diguanylate cyclase (GGDEF)-like protein
VAISAIAGGLSEGLFAALAAAALGALYAIASAGEFEVGLATSVLSARFALYGITAAFLGAFADAHHSVQLQLRELASLDPLTRVSNVTSFYEKLGVLQQRSIEFSMLLLDIDDLKAVNDRYGHQAGSDAIRTVADIVRKVVRAGDCVARYGGDEFVVTLRDAGRDGAAIVAGRIQEMLHAEELERAPQHRIGVSIGIAVFGEDGMTSEELLSAADRDMYVNKRQRKENLVRRPAT